MDGPYNHWLELPLIESIDTDVAYSILKVYSDDYIFLFDTKQNFLLSSFLKNSFW